MADRVIVTELRVDTSQFAADLNKITGLLESLKKSSEGAAQGTAAIGAQGKQVNAALGGLNRTAGQAANTLRTGFAGVGRNFTTLNSNILQSSAALNTMKSSASQLGSILKVTFSGYLAKQVLEMADAVYKANLRLELATNSAEEYAQAQQSISRMTQETFVDVDTAARTYQRFDMALSETGTSAQDIAKAVEAVGYAARIAGSQGNELRSTLLQLTQAMQANRLGGDELRSLMENAPVLTRAFAHELQTTTGSLRDFGAAGKINSKVILSALTRNYDEWKKKNAELGVSFTEMIIAMKNTFSVAINEMFEAVGLRQAMGSFVKIIQENAKAIVIFLGIIAGFAALEIATAAVLKLSAAFTALRLAASGKGLVGAAAGISNFVKWAQINFGMLINTIGALGVAFIALGATIAGLTIYGIYKHFEKASASIKDASADVETLNETMARQQKVIDELNKKDTKYTYTLDVASMKKDAIANMSSLERALGDQGKALQDSIMRQSQDAAASLGKNYSTEMDNVRKQIEKNKIAAGEADLFQKYAPKKFFNAMGQAVDIFVDPEAKKNYLKEFKEIKVNAAKETKALDLIPIYPEIITTELDAVIKKNKWGEKTAEEFKNNFYKGMAGQDQLVLVHGATEQGMKAAKDMQEGYLKAGGKELLPEIVVKPVIDETAMGDIFDLVKEEDKVINFTPNTQELKKALTGVGKDIKVGINADTKSFKTDLENSTKKMSVNKIQVSTKKFTLKTKQMEIDRFNEQLDKIIAAAKPSTTIKIFEWLDFDIDKMAEKAKKSWTTILEWMILAVKVAAVVVKEVIMNMMPWDYVLNKTLQFMRLVNKYLIPDTDTFRDALKKMGDDAIDEAAKMSKDIKSELNNIEIKITPEMRDQLESLFADIPKTGPLPGPIGMPEAPVKSYADLAKEWKLSEEQALRLKKEMEDMEKLKANPNYVQQMGETFSSTATSIQNSADKINLALNTPERTKYIKNEISQTEALFKAIDQVAGAYTTVARAKKIGYGKEEQPALPPGEKSTKEAAAKADEAKVLLPSALKYRITLKNASEDLLGVQEKTTLSTKEYVKQNLELSNSYADITEALINYSAGNTVLGTRTNQTAKDINALNTSLSNYDDYIRKINEAKTPEQKAKIPELEKGIETEAANIKRLYAKEDPFGYAVSTYLSEPVTKAFEGFKQNYAARNKDAANFLKKQPTLQDTIEERARRTPEGKLLPKGPFYQAPDLTSLGYFMKPEDINASAKNASEALHAANMMIQEGLRRDALEVQKQQQEINDLYYTNQISAREADMRGKILQQQTKPIMKAETRLNQQEVAGGAAWIDTRANIGMMHANEALDKSLLDLLEDLKKGTKNWAEYSAAVAEAHEKQQKFAEAREYKRIDIYTPDNPGAKATDQRIEEFATKVAALRAQGDKLNRGQYAMKIVLEGDVKSKEQLYALTKSAFAYVDAADASKSTWAKAWAMNDQATAEATQRLVTYEKEVTNAVDTQSGAAGAIGAGFTTALGMLVGSTGIFTMGVGLAAVSTADFQKELVKVSDTVKDMPTLYGDKQQAALETDQEKIKATQEYNEVLKKMQESLDPSEFEGFGKIIYQLGRDMPRTSVATKDLKESIDGLGESTQNIDTVSDAANKSGDALSYSASMAEKLNRTLAAAPIEKMKIPVPPTPAPVHEQMVPAERGDLFQAKQAMKPVMGEQALPDTTLIKSSTDAINGNTAAIEANSNATATATINTGRWQEMAQPQEDMGFIQRLRDQSQSVLGYGEAVRAAATSEKMNKMRKEEMNIAQIKLNAQLEAGKMSWKAYQDAVIAMKMENADLFSDSEQRLLGLHAGLQKVINDMPNMATATQTIVTETFSGLSTAFYDFMDKGVSASMQTFYDKIKETIAKIVLEMVIFKNLAGGLQETIQGGEGGKGFLSKLFGGAGEEDKTKKKETVADQKDAAKELVKASTTFLTSAETGSLAISGAAKELFIAAQEFANASGGSTGGSGNMNMTGLVSSLFGAPTGGGTVTGGVGGGLGGTGSDYNFGGGLTFGNPSAPADGGIPGLADGGIVKKPMLSMIGEAGPEAVIPLEKMSRLLGDNNGGGGTARPITNIVINNSVSDKADVKVKESGEGGEHIIEIMVEQKVTDMFQSGTMDQFMRANYGLIREGKM